MMEKITVALGPGQEELAKPDIGEPKPLEPYQEPPEAYDRRWVDVAIFHLPLPSSAISKCLDVLGPAMKPHQLTVRPQPEDDSILLVGYWEKVQL